MKKKVNGLRAVLASVGVILLNMIIGNLLYLNPLVSGIFEQFKNHPTIRSMEYFGGFGNWIALTLGFSLILESFVIFLYILLYNAIPSKGWKKGLFYGLIIGLLRSIPEAFNQWTLFNYPDILILIQTINTFLGYLVFGVMLGFVFDKAKVITEEV
jgi:hypothetical protein